MRVSKSTRPEKHVLLTASIIQVRIRIHDYILLIQRDARIITVRIVARRGREHGLQMRHLVDGDQPLVLAAAVGARRHDLVVARAVDQLANGLVRGAEEVLEQAGIADADDLGGGGRGGRGALEDGLYDGLVLKAAGAFHEGGEADEDAGGRGGLGHGNRD